ncbi:HTH-type transcriptional regulator SinR [compost metagenome]
MADWLTLIGARIRAMRIDKGLSQEKLAELADLNASYVGKIERGEKNVTFRSLEKVTVALDVPVQDLFKYITPDAEYGENQTLIKILTLLQSKTPDDQNKALNLLQLVLNWNE